MKVLWISPTPSMFDELKYGGWVASLEQIFRKYLPNIDLGIVFEYPLGSDKTKKNNVTYYPISSSQSTKDRINSKLGKTLFDKSLFVKIQEVVEDFKPDIIQCFGSEYYYGLIAKHVKVPVVIHMQGFLNIYDLSSRMAYDSFDTLRYHTCSPKTIYHALFEQKIFDNRDTLERLVMKSNRYFMGRTSWDKNIVKYYSPNSRYYYCPEAIRSAIYNSEKHWSYKKSNVPRFVTITQAGSLKGNEIILRTAYLLKRQFSFDFEWRVAGNKESFEQFEAKTGISHKDVNVKLLGMISAEEIVNELSEANIYVHPAIIDNSPNSLCEAQLIGCPVVASYVGGIPDLVENGKTGFLYPYNEPHTLAFMLMNMVNDEELLSKVSENEIETARNRHDPKNISRVIEGIYKEIITS